MSATGNQPISRYTFGGDLWDFVDLNPITPRHIAQAAKRFKAVARERIKPEEQIPEDLFTRQAAECSLPAPGPTNSARFRASELLSELNAMMAADPVGAAAYFMAGDQLTRKGDILNPNRILKTDQYPGLHKDDLQMGAGAQPLLYGAPNYRGLAGSQIRGVAQPTINGIRAVLRQNDAGPGGRPCVWINLREEPVVYIAGKPFTLRESAYPLSNLEATGISPSDLEELEENLRQEVIDEIQRTGGKALLHDEDNHENLTRAWVKVDPEDVKTPRQVYQQMLAEGFQVEYHRVPVSDEKTPEYQDYDQLVSILKNVDPDTPRIFNCHAGRGRTTTGMAIADLIEQAMHTPTTSNLLDTARSRSHLHQEAHSVSDLAEALESFSNFRKRADLAIERAAAVQNLRQAVLNRRPPPRAHYSTQQDALLARSNQFLERYLLLIQFAQYLNDEKGEDFKEGFAQWVGNRPYVQDTLRLAGQTLQVWHSRQLEQ